MFLLLRCSYIASLKDMFRPFFGLITFFFAKQTIQLAMALLIVWFALQRKKWSTWRWQTIQLAMALLIVWFALQRKKWSTWRWQTIQLAMALLIFRWQRGNAGGAKSVKSHAKKLFPRGHPQACGPSVLRGRGTVSKNKIQNISISTLVKMLL